MLPPAGWPSGVEQPAPGNSFDLPDIRIALGPAFVLKGKFAYFGQLGKVRRLICQSSDVQGLVFGQHSRSLEARRSIERFESAFQPRVNRVR